MIPPLLELALGCFRSPLAYGHLADRDYPLPIGFPDQFADLCSAISPGHIADSARRLDSTPEELEAAVRFFARRVLLEPGNDAYRTLGLPPDAPVELIRRQYRLLIKLFHPDRLGQATVADLACSGRLNTAYHQLSDVRRREHYDREHPHDTSQVRFSDPRGFFGSNHAALQAGTRSPRIRATPRRRRSVTIVLGTSIALIATISGGLWLLEPAHPLRSTKPPAANTDRPRPSYLGTLDAPEAPTPITLPVASERSTPDPGLDAARQPPPALRPDLPGATAKSGTVDAGEVSGIGARIADELQIAVRRGDERKLQQLLTSDSAARLQHLLGQAAAPANRATRGQVRPWVSLTGMHWQRRADGQIQGRGRLLVENPSHAEVGAQVISATIELTLAASGQDYHISAMRLQQD